MALGALIIAIVGAVTGIASLAWNVASFKQQGWHLRVNIGAVETGRNPKEVDPETKVYIYVTNTGRQPCLISQIDLCLANETNRRGPRNFRSLDSELERVAVEFSELVKDDRGVWGRRPVQISPSQVLGFDVIVRDFQVARQPTVARAQVMAGSNVYVSNVLPIRPREMPRIWELPPTER